MSRTRRPFVTALGAWCALAIAACSDAPVQTVPAGPAGTFPAAFAPPGTDAVVVGAANIARCAITSDDATGQLLDAIPGTVLALGDNAMPYGRLSDYQNCYGPTWGRHLTRTRAVIGNHEYDSSATANGAFDYFGAAAGPRGLGYYSFDTGDWHVVVLNDQTKGPGFAAGSVQDQWLVNDLAANAGKCILAVHHIPLFLSTNTAGYIENPSRRTLWNRFAAGGVSVVLAGNQHHYERFAPMLPSGARDDANGMRSFNVGTGGDGLDLPTVAIHPNSEVRGAAYGVLKLTLHAASYDWEFVHIPGETFTDAGSGTCPGVTPPPTNRAPTANPGGPYRSEDAVAFDGSGSSDPDGDSLASFAWDFGDGSSGSGMQPTHTYTADGTYTVSLTVTDARGATSAPSQATVTIGNLPPAVNAGPDERTAPGVFTLRAAFSDPGANDAPWSWTIAWGDGFSSSGTASAQGTIAASHPYLLPGQYTVRVSVTDKDGGVASDEMVVTVALLP